MNPRITAIVAIFGAALLALGSACTTPEGEVRHGSPPPGSHSPFAGPDRSDPSAAQRDEPEPGPELPEEDEPEEPEAER